MGNKAAIHISCVRYSFKAEILYYSCLVFKTQENFKLTFTFWLLDGFIMVGYDSSAILCMTLQWEKCQTKIHILANITKYN